MSIRWISKVPSKIVKIVDYRAVSTGQRPTAPVVSARIQHGLSEMNAGFHPAPHAIAERGADALQSADEGSREVGTHSALCGSRPPPVASTTLTLA